MTDIEAIAMWAALLGISLILLGVVKRVIGLETDLELARMTEGSRT